MAIDYDRDIGLQTQDQEWSYDQRDVMLYALAVGLGTDPTNADELPFVNERYLGDTALRVLPTFATLAPYNVAPIALDLDRTTIVDGGRELTIHAPMPTSARTLVDNRIVEIHDKGAAKGAIVVRESVVRDADRGTLYATVVTHTFARGDGGFGGPQKPQPAPHSPPGRAPDLSLDIATMPGQALLYRLCGDRNPLHSDPAFAAKAGFARPILHGMCTYGITARAVLQTFAGFDPRALRRHVAQFSAPVFPGETVTVDLWQNGTTISFEAQVKARGVTVVRNGLTELNNAVTPA